MDRRLFALSAGLSLFALTFGRAARTETSLDAFQHLLDKMRSDPSLASSGDEAVLYRQVGPTDSQRRGNPELPRRWTSDLKISEHAIDLIIACEVTSQAVYEKRYMHPIWPKVSSGVTVGAGYDLGYQEPDYIADDWTSIIGADVIARLQSVAKLKGSKARDALAGVSDIVVDWHSAYANFSRILKLYAGETARYFPNCEKLSPDSFGALVSLVYNRGSASKKNSKDPLDRRKEMREIKSLCLQGKFGDVPAQIRAMERLWNNNPQTRGVVTRREAEAALFEAGLS